MPGDRNGAKSLVLSTEDNEEKLLLKKKEENLARMPCHTYHQTKLKQTFDFDQDRGMVKQPSSLQCWLTYLTNR